MSDPITVRISTHRGDEHLHEVTSDSTTLGGIGDAYEILDGCKTYISLQLRTDKAGNVPSRHVDRFPSPFKTSILDIIYLFEIYGLGRCREASTTG